MTATEAAESFWGSWVIIAALEICWIGEGGALSPIKKQQKKIKESFRGSPYWKFRESLRLCCSSKDILDKVGKESITGSVNCQPSYFIDKLTFSNSRVTCSYYALKISTFPPRPGAHPAVAFDYSEAIKCQVSGRRERRNLGPVRGVFRGVHSGGSGGSEAK